MKLLNWQLIFFKMTGLLIFNFLRWSHVLQVIVLTFGTALSFFCAVYNKHVNWYCPFISETGAYTPEIGIFSFTLIIGSFLGLMVIFYRYASIYLTTPSDQKVLLKWNSLSSIAGIFSMLGLAGVAAFPMSTVFWFHLLCAGLYFGSMMFYALSTTIYTFKKEGRSKLFKFRIVLCILIVTILIFLIILFPISHMKWHNNNKIIPALKEPSNTGFALILITSVLEWCYMSVTLVYILTLFFELQNQTFMLTLHQNRELSSLSGDRNTQIQNEREVSGSETEKSEVETPT